MRCARCNSSSRVEVGSRGSGDRPVGSIWQLIVPVVCLLSGLATSFRADAADPAPGFEADIAPLLARACLECHNPSDRKGGLDLTSREAARQGGDSGAALDAEQPATSLLWERVAADEMPPKQPLSAADKQQLQLWLQGGAPWSEGRIDRFRYTSESRAGYDWWSLRPLTRPEVPAVKIVEANSNPIDHFVEAARAARQLAHNPPADRRTLARRAWFDLLGLPPTPEELEEFVQDSAPQAWERLIDRLLARTEYGERWGRHWLDVVRFGESQGFERDKLRTNSWPYRDWVVAALNRDLPYNEFIRLQIAGDVLQPDDPEAVIATGFIVAAPWDEVGQSQQSLAMKMVVRQDELEDVIGTTAQTFLGLTANCARCHDHKFDPISQTEYYRLSAALAGVRHGERESLTDAGRARLAERTAELKEQLSAHGRALDAFDRPHRAAILAARQNAGERPAPPEPLALWEFAGDLRDSRGTLHGTAHGAARVEEGKLVLDGGADTWVDTVPLEKDLREKTLAVWVALTRLDQQGGAALSVQSSSGAVFDAIVFGEREAGQWMAGSNGFVRTQSLQGAVEQAVAPQAVQMTLVYGADQSITMYRNGLRYGSPYKAGSLATYEKGKAQVLFGMRHSPPGGNRMLAAVIDRAALFDRALSPDEVASLAGVVSDVVTNEEIVSRLTPPQRIERNRLVRAFTETQSRLTLLSSGKVYAVNPGVPETTHYLERGNPQLKRDVMTPGTLQAVSGLNADFQLPADAPDGIRRKLLAEWISSERNPLTPRVIVNRIWQHHLGVGLVETPNDFGFNGARPSHPELLDWLASELIAPSIQATPAEGERPHPWSLKHLHRLILTSATYQQGSGGLPAAQATDAGNRYLWRHSPQRLEAEAVRDAILSVSGELNPAVGGPGFQDFRTFTFNSQFYEMLDPVGFDFHRRTLYRTWVRSGRSDFLDVFDCPDPSTTAPRRAVTTTPLQALAMLNNSFTLRMSERFAERARAEVGDDLALQLRRICELAWGRRPSAAELAAGTDFVRSHGLPAFCRVVFNSNEFLYVD